MTNTPHDPFNARTRLAGAGEPIIYYRLGALEEAGLGRISRLPFSIKVLLEALLRQVDGFAVTEEDVRRLAAWDALSPAPVELPFKPARVIMQDFTGVPAVVDLAAMRSAMARAGGDPTRVNPLIPVDLVIDHSVLVDSFGSRNALIYNAEREFERNRERYEFLKWGQNAFANFRVVPPATGIVHQVNLEYLATVIQRRGDPSAVAPATVVYPDSVVGTDSHTTMINGLGVLGWGVGGIEAEAVMLGQPIYMLTPQVIGFKLTGELPEGATATDLVLTVTQMLRAKGVVDKFVEFFGPGVGKLSLPDRATIANMAPEYGATTGFFPVDDETLRYLRLSGRSDELVDLVDRYSKAQGLFRADDTPDPVFTDVLALDMATVVPSLAGPKRPQDRVSLAGGVRSSFRKAFPNLGLPNADFGLEPQTLQGEIENRKSKIRNLDHGAIVIASITSCTNTSNPSVMVGAGLLAKKAAERGLAARPWVKTSLAPGSKVVTSYLDAAGLTPYLEQVGFYTVGYGCTTCIAEGTPVLLSNGTARRIEQMPNAGGAVLFCPTPGGELGMAVQAETMDKGARDCISLVLQDGRTLICTPDHEILCADRRWVRADALAPGQDRVLVGLEVPLDEPSDDETGYELIAGGLKFTMNTPQERRRMLAFLRLLGHLLGDGSISVAAQGRMTVGQAVDREVVLDDIELVTGKRPAATLYDERKWTIVLPQELTDSIIALPGVRAGRRIHQAPALPACVLDEKCPVAVVREFLGGVFGADGQGPALHRLSEREEDAILKSPAYSQSARPEHVEQLKEVMHHLGRLLARCGVKTDGIKVYEFPVRRSASSHPAAQDGIPRVEVRMELPDGLSFVEQVGFRYCVDKAMRASAAAVYWRMVDKIHRQRLWMSARLEALHRTHPELSFNQARAMAASELQQRETVVFPHYSLLMGCDRFSRLPKPTDRKFQPLHRDSCGFPSPVELFDQLGIRAWFAPLLSRTETDYSKRYCAEKTSMTLPTFSLQVLDRRAAGKHAVFDLSVNDLHAFVADTVCVHNCIGNSGPLPEAVASAIQAQDLVVSAVISGNRNFEGRVHPLVKANYLASPPLVVAYALAGTVDIDLTREPLGTDRDGQPVYLSEIWPSQDEIKAAIASSLNAEMYRQQYADVFTGNPMWNAVAVPQEAAYRFDPTSTYIQEPPFFVDLAAEPAPRGDILGARALAVLGDNITTDHISPAGSIAAKSPAGRYLLAHGVPEIDFNQYGTRRGSHEVMMRGTFANIRIRNKLAPGVEGGFTIYQGAGEQRSGGAEVTAIYDAAMKYQAAGIPTIVLAGKEYGTGSSRDWAAKGPFLLGVKAVIAESFERIHRSNLVGMGILPLVFLPGQNAESLGLTGTETFDIVGESANGEWRMAPKQAMMVRATSADGQVKTFQVQSRIDTPVEVEYYRNGGILHTVLRQMMKA